MSVSILISDNRAFQLKSVTRDKKILYDNKEDNASKWHNNYKCICIQHCSIKTHTANANRVIGTESTIQ